MNAKLKPLESESHCTKTLLCLRTKGKTPKLNNTLTKSLSLKMSEHKQKRTQGIPEELAHP